MKLVGKISLAVALLATVASCKEAKKETENVEPTTTINKVEAVEKEIENTVKELEKSATELENSLDSLEDI